MNNHLGDTNKMVSDTPRTDAKRGFHDLDTAVDAEFSEQLERELNAASKERDDALMMLGMYRMKSDEQNQRIKRLEEALEGTVKWIVHLADSGDAGFWDVEKQSEIIAARAALKKESKP